MRRLPEHPQATLSPRERRVGGSLADWLDDRADHEKISPRERRTGLVLLVVLVLFVLGLFAFVMSEVAVAGTVYLHDPSLTVRGADSFQSRVNRGLRGTDLTLTVFPRFSKLQQALATAPPDLLMMPPFLAKKLRTLTLRPILIRERRRSVVYEVVIVGLGTFEDLRGKTLACAGNARDTGFLNGVILAGTGLTTRSVRVLSLGKDLDAVMAAGKGAVAGACTSPRSLALLQRANPVLGNALKVLRRVEGIPDTVLYATGSAVRAEEAGWTRSLTTLHKKRAGRKALKLLLANRLVPVDAKIKEKLR